MRKQILCAVWSAAVVLLCGSAVRGAEPVMSDYSSLPLFQSKSVMPNILIMLDNSGSMNFPAYSEPFNPDTTINFGNGQVLTGAAYRGTGCSIGVFVVDQYDDAEERLKDNKLIYCPNVDFRRDATLHLTTDLDTKITLAGIMPVIQVARSGPAADAGDTAAAAKGLQVAGAFEGRSMSDAGSLPAAGSILKAAAFKDPGGKGLELEPYGMDSGQADGVIVDQWYLSREQELKPFMVAAASHNHNCGNAASHGSNCSCLSHNCVSHAQDCTDHSDHCAATTTTISGTTTSSSLTTSTTTTMNYCAINEDQVVGIRFQNIEVPPAVEIETAYIVFTAKDSDSQPTTLSIKGQAADQAAAFSAADADISSRPDTLAAVTWSVNPWTPGLRNADTTTPDLKAIVQEIINGSGWASGNNMVFKIRGLVAGGSRRAYSYDGKTSSGQQPYLFIQFKPCVDQEYYGYFDPKARYSYSNKFERDPAGEWSGNFLNWATMRRIDVLRKALMGGKRPCETCNGATDLIGEIPPASQNQIYWQTYYKGSGVSRYKEAWYGVRNGDLYVNEITDSANPDAFQFPLSSNWNSFDLKHNIKVAINSNDEPAAFCPDNSSSEAGNPCGVLQKVGTQARWGDIWFNTSNQGGQVATAVGGGATGLSNIKNDLQNTSMGTETPLAETLLTAMAYFMQDATILPNTYANGATKPTNVGGTFDPYYDKGELIPCAKSFVLMLTDGVPNLDIDIPAAYRDTDKDGNDDGVTRKYDDSGSDYLDDVALYSHVNDLRTDMEGVQTMDTFVVYAFGKDPTAETLLKEAAINGGFTDYNNNKKPDGYLNDGDFKGRPPAERREWDKDGDGIPDNFFKADDGYKLEKQLLAAINSMLNKAASGTAVSVLATTGEGEGTLVQAIFRPSLIAGMSEVTWTGFLQSLWVDAKGNIREDTNGNRKLDVDVDRVVSYYFDETTNETRVKRYVASAAAPYPDKATAQSDNVSLTDLESLWEAGAMLADRDADNRKIYTYVGDGLAMASPAAFGSGSCVAFSKSNAAVIRPFLGIEDTTTYSYLNSLSAAYRAENLIEYIRGNDNATLTPPNSVRSRKLDGKVWKLGDIVYSTPVTISKPVEKYGIIYDDLTYKDYLAKYGDNATTARESMVYVGANDGMLHAFTGGYFNKLTNGFEQRMGSERIGDELWAYIPRALLPHLKWLARQDYDMTVHVPYVDLKPKIVDVRIFTDDGKSGVHPGGWGTVLIGGMNFGGKHIWANKADGTKDADYYPSYFAIDITDPRNPQLLWDRWFPDMGLTINQPTVLQVGRTYDEPLRTWKSDDNWFLAIGSGFDDFNANVSHTGSLYIIDIKTGGTVYQRFQTAETQAYMNTPIAIDKSLDYNVDAVYVAANSFAGTAYTGKVYRLGIPITSIPYIEGKDARYDPNPANWKWTMMLADTNMPAISAPFTISSDKIDNVWLYLGSGRFHINGDKTSSVQNYLVGIKDPFYNKQGAVTGGPARTPDCYHQYDVAVACTLSLTDLLYANPYTVKPDGVVSTDSALLINGQSALTTWDALLAEMKKQNTLKHWEKWQGWYRKMVLSGTNPSERVVNKPTVFGGITLFPGYTPNSDTCGYGGSSSLYALYYETGTAFKRPVLTGLNNTVEIQYRMDLGYGLSSSFGIHAAKEKGDTATVYSQMSTGIINEITIDPAFDTRSGIEYWKEGR